jgi:two-component system, cell cycle sensor histidine kinase and response regulator CckA
MRPTILLADDDRAVRESLRKLLHTEQYEVVLAVDGKEAVEKFLADPKQFDLILTDLNMPLRNGWASMDRLLEVKPFLPVILLTGMVNQRQLAETSQVSALVEKPINVPALLHLIRELLAEITRGQLHRLPPKQRRFHYVPAYDAFPTRPQTDPYAHWGLNE